MKKNEAATNPDEFVHARPAVYSDDGVQHEHAHGGITIREYFAIKIMAGFGFPTGNAEEMLLTVARASGESVTQVLARVAIERADALIDALNEQEPQTGKVPT